MQCDHCYNLKPTIIIETGEDEKFDLCHNCINY